MTPNFFITVLTQNNRIVGFSMKKESAQNMCLWINMGLVTKTIGVVSPLGWHGAESTGGVSPLAWLQPATVIIDEALNDYEVIWAAAGHPHAVFPITFDELIHATKARRLVVGD